MKESKNTFNTFQQLEKVISWTIEPVVHFIFPYLLEEDLSCLVVECKITDQWYISSYFKEWDEADTSKAYENISEILKRYDVPSAAWSILKDDIEKFKSGLKTWPQIKLSAIPLLADMETCQIYITEKLRRSVG
jgi:hypothetical protein